MPTMSSTSACCERLHEPGAGRDARGWPFARTGRDDVRDRGQCSALEILEVLRHRHDVREELRVIDVARVGEQRDSGDLLARWRRAARRNVDRRVVVLHVELPADALRLEPIEDRREAVKPSAGIARPRLAPASRRSRKVVGQAAARREAKN